MRSCVHCFYKGAAMVGCLASVVATETDLPWEAVGPAVLRLAQRPPAAAVSPAVLAAVGACSAATLEIAVVDAASVPVATAVDLVTDDAAVAAAAAAVPPATLAALWSGHWVSARAWTWLRVGGREAAWRVLASDPADAPDWVAIAATTTVRVRHRGTAEPTDAAGWTAAMDAWAERAAARAAGVGPTARAVTAALAARWRAPSADGHAASLPTRDAGVLLYGPTGSGKTLLLNALAECAPPFVAVVRLRPAMYTWRDLGSNERALADAFARAEARAAGGQCVLMLIDDVDAYVVDSTPDRDGPAAPADAQARRARELLRCLDGVARARTRPVAVLAATGRPDALPAAVRAPWRLAAGVAVPLPDAPTRQAILARLLGPSPAVAAVAAACTSFSPADLAELARRVLLTAWARADGGGDGELDVHVLEAAAAAIRPSALATLPSAALVDARAWQRGRTAPLAGLGGAAARLAAVLAAHTTAVAAAPSALAQMGLRPARGVLVTGPPGTGKTALVMEAAARTSLRLLAVDAATLRSKVVGESERQLRELFREARRAAPCLLLLDHFDALGTPLHPKHRPGGGRMCANEPPKRSYLSSHLTSAPRRGATSSGDAASRLTTAFLTELDGVFGSTGGEGQPAVVVVAVSASPELLDPAVRRPGRLDQWIALALPDAAARHGTAELAQRCAAAKAKTNMDTAGGLCVRRAQRSSRPTCARCPWRPRWTPTRATSPRGWSALQAAPAPTSRRRAARPRWLRSARRSRRARRPPSWWSRQRTWSRASPWCCSVPEHHRLHRRPPASPIRSPAPTAFTCTSLSSKRTSSVHTTM